ncbi:hypothetical protein [Micromonospora sp. NPDC048830]|uniref:hypothetical protein n=1 Tax=Micromonospora sp. NPDC048830 TaxID=3364257 RepID=UPI003720A690
MTAPPHRQSAESATADRRRAVADALRRSAALRADGALTDAYAWAQYAYQRCCHLPAEDEHRMRAAALLAPLAAQTGQPHLAVTVYQDLIVGATKALGADHAQTLRARAALAQLRHDLGDCATGLADLAGVHAAARQRYGHHARLSLHTLVSLGGLYRDCGHHHLATRCLLTASTGIGRYLPPDDPLVDMVAAAIGTPPSLNHPAVCTQQQPRIGVTP